MKSLKFIYEKKYLKPKNIEEKKFENKNSWKFFRNLFFDFPKIFSVEIFHLMSTLRMQKLHQIRSASFGEIGTVQTDRHTDKGSLLLG